jgi:cellulose synthase/poly-beta-1,6-N-acetylglucosamine synthase-like glycosyltransferase
VNKVSIIIPARGESYGNLLNTVRSIKENATGDYEIIIGLDGKPWYEDVEPDFGENITFVKFPRVVGIKTNITAMASMAKGKYIYKSDAHCKFGKGFDEILQADMESDWIVMPRFKIIKDDWSIQERDGKEEIYDYFYLCCPFTDPRGFRFKAGGHWRERTDERIETLIDETPQMHGSGWFMERDRYFALGGFPNIDPHGHAQEPLWLGLKNQLEGGKLMVNKKTWYAHLHQQGNKRGYHMDKAQENISYDLAATKFMSDPRMFDWLEKNMPMPTWPDNWRELLTNYQNK